MKTRAHKSNPPPPEKAKREHPDLLIRAASVEVRAAEGDKPASVRMSVSSEEPVLTYSHFNDQWQRVYEILDHGAGSVNMARCKDGLVILDRHYGDQIGLMRCAVSDKKIGGMVEFCTGERAQEIAADAAKGLRRNVSVGYQVDTSSYRAEGMKDGIPVVRAMSWMPYEASFEPVPADTTVGVNRAAEATNATAAASTAAQTTQRETKMDPKVIAQMYELAARHGIDAVKVSALITDGKGMDEVRALVIDKQTAENEAQRVELAQLKSRKPDAPAVQTVPPVGGSTAAEAKAVRNYSLLRVVQSLVSGKPIDGLEREMSEEVARINGRSASGVWVPHGVFSRRDLTKAGTSAASVQTTVVATEFIDLIRTYSILDELGVRTLSGLVGDIALPKMTAGATGYWVAENNAITESTPTLGQVTGSPHTCGALVDLSRRLIMQSTPSAEAFVQNEILERIARTCQIAVFAGTGADGQPSAITSASGINNPSVTQGTPTYAELLSFPGSILADSAASDNQKWAMTAEVWEKLAATYLDPTVKVERVLDWKSKTCLGRPYAVSEDVGANSLFYGDWRQVILAFWGVGIDLKVDPYTLSNTGATRLVALQDCDVLVRLGQALAYNAAVTA